MITFSNFNEFDTYFLNEFQGLESTIKNKNLLNEKIEDLYINDRSIDYSCKGLSWTLFDLNKHSMLTINF